MAQRKLQQEIEKCFKRVAEGVQAFEGIFEKIQQASNPSQKEKLEDALKREIKKLQRQRDQIKTWAASNEIKDKKPLLEQRKLIETQMEKFKAVEKEMKTKAYSKEGLSAAAKLDPKEKEKLETCQFLSNMVEELERQVETIEAEAESLQANLKKGKKDTSRAERVAELERITERHKWHQGKLELLLRSLENGGVDTDQVLELQEGIKYYVENNQEADFIEDDSLYDDLNLTEEEDAFGMVNELDHISSQDAHSAQEDTADADHRANGTTGTKPRPPSGPEPPGTAGARRPSTHAKSPLPVLATLHTSAPPMPLSAAPVVLKPAPAPTRPPGETLKYASAAAAAAAAAASDLEGVGIAPLPPPSTVASSASHASPTPAPLAGANGLKKTARQSPAVEHARLAEAGPSLRRKNSTATGGVIPGPVSVPPADAPHRPPVPSEPAMAIVAPTPAAAPLAAEDKIEGKRPRPSRLPRPRADADAHDSIRAQSSERPEADGGAPVQTNGVAATVADSQMELQESIYHLPTSLQDLLLSFENTKRQAAPTTLPSVQRHLAVSDDRRPDTADADKPRHYKPEMRFKSPNYYPQDPLPMLDQPRIYSRIDADTLFYLFYYAQGSYQQYLAAKSLKTQSWRFHKQYQTWFQRHEEPKTITEEFEQGTYRFFDYESTW
ncbi:MAG: general negative regulator of transcription subunit 5 [Phylliscum demangeonii]|nr:MAG: general negative regulator of transcription subunit 5 [Phylliscum demangeonii]